MFTNPDAAQAPDVLIASAVKTVNMSLFIIYDWLVFRCFYGGLFVSAGVGYGCENCGTTLLTYGS
jgi:hypothetical protein